MMFTPLPRSVTRPASFLILVAWLASMAALIDKSYLKASANLATDLARYGSNATWRGIYYRGDKIGFTVSQTVSKGDGFELQEDGRLQMALLGASSAALLHTAARVDRNFGLQSFDFSLDPGTGAMTVHGTVEASTGISPGGGAARLKIDITSPDGTTRSDTRELPELPVLSLNLSRLLAGGHLVPGTTKRWMILDPATLRNAPVEVRIGEKSCAAQGSRRFRRFASTWDSTGSRRPPGSPTQARWSERKARWASSPCASRAIAHNRWPFRKASSPICSRPRPSSRRRRSGSRNRGTSVCCGCG
jgi:hypothetical protein